MKLNEDDVKLLEELFIVEGIVFDPYPVESYEVAYDNLISQTISSLQQAVEDLVITVDKVLLIAHVKALHLEHVVNWEILCISVLIHIPATVATAKERE